MSDAVLRSQVATPASEPDNPRSKALVSVAPIEANDNETHSPRLRPEARMFELPALIWGSMIGSYAIFLLALLGATGGDHAAFAIAISAIYVTMFFGTARTMLRQAPQQPRSVLSRAGSVLQTAYGPLPKGAVYGQVLIVPAVVAFFGIGICVISAVVI